MIELTSPKITCLMECSVDGRIDESRWSTLYDKKGEGTPDVYYETKNAIAPEVCLLGRNTIETNFYNEKFHSLQRSKPKSLKPFLGIRGTETMTAVFDSAGKIAYPSNQIWGSTLLVVLGSELVSEEYLEFLRSREISYTFAGGDGHDYAAAVTSLYEDFGLKNMLLCGGGILNGFFLKAKLIDELYTVIYPGLDGLKGINSIFEVEGKAGDLPCKGQTLELLSCRSVRAGVVLLHYKIHKSL